MNIKSKQTLHPGVRDWWGQGKVWLHYLRWPGKILLRSHLSGHFIKEEEVIGTCIREELSRQRDCTWEAHRKEQASSTIGRGISNARTNAEQEVQVTRAFLGGWRWETSGILGQHWHSISSFGVTCELDHCAQHGASEKLHYDSQMLSEDKLQLSWRLPISVLKWGQEQTHLVLPREMNFKRYLNEQNSS